MLTLNICGIDAHIYRDRDGSFYSFNEFDRCVYRHHDSPSAAIQYAIASAAELAVEVYGSEAGRIAERQEVCPVEAGIVEPYDEF